MKLFAITPDAFSNKDVLAHVPRLKDNGVSFLYLRSPRLTDCPESLGESLIRAGIVPIIPYDNQPICIKSGFGVHFKSSQPVITPSISGTPGLIITASCHDCAVAEKLLGGSVAYVFLSPAFPPFSKPADTRKLLPRSRVKELVARFGERIVLLGGLNRERIKALQQELGHDFSVGGITMFFNTKE